MAKDGQQDVKKRWAQVHLFFV